MADIDKSLPNTLDPKLPSPETLQDIKVEEMVEKGPKEVTPEEDGGESDQLLDRLAIANGYGRRQVLVHASRQHGTHDETSKRKYPADDAVAPPHEAESDYQDEGDDVYPVHADPPTLAVFCDGYEPIFRRQSWSSMRKTRGYATRQGRVRYD